MSYLHFSPFPVLSSERLVLRNLSQEDDVELYSIRTNPVINRFIVRKKPTGLDDVKDFISHIHDGIKTTNWIYWAICLKKSNELIGTICLFNFSDDECIAEIGYELHPVFQGRGYMTEAFNCVKDFAFNRLYLKKLEACTHVDNINSTRFLRRLYFKPEFNSNAPIENNMQVFSLRNHFYRDVKPGKRTPGKGISNN